MTYNDEREEDILAHWWKLWFGIAATNRGETHRRRFVSRNSYAASEYSKLEISANDEQLHSSTGDELQWSSVSRWHILGGKTYTNIGLNLHQADVELRKWEWRWDISELRTPKILRYRSMWLSNSDNIPKWVDSPFIARVAVAKIQDEETTVMITCKTDR